MLSVTSPEIPALDTSSPRKTSRHSTVPHRESPNNTISLSPILRREFKLLNLTSVETNFSKRPLFVSRNVTHRCACDNKTNKHNVYDNALIHFELPESPMDGVENP